MEQEEIVEDSVTVSPFKERLWALLAPVVEAQGYQIFDLEAPVRPGAALRVFIWKGQSTKGSSQAVILDDCARVSKAIDLIPELDEVIEGHYVLEVSSPGINRKLTRPEHFSTALGERVKVVTVDGEALLGVMKSCEHGVFTVHDEQRDEEVQVPIEKVRRAKIDFRF